MNFTSYNPATGSVVWQGKAASSEDVENAVDKAHSAGVSWKKLAFDERAGFCRKFAKALLEKKDAFARTISEEMGKPFWESLTEVQAMINKVEISIEAYKERCKERSEQTANFRLMTRFQPYGVVGVFGPFNFPGHLPNGHIIPALLAGNTILFKPSELTPRVGEEYCTIWQMIGLPDGVLQLLQGPKEVASCILNQKEVRGIFFTGSVGAGQAIQVQSTAFPGRILALEMGGNNPLVVSKVSDQRAATLAIIQSAFLTSGQRCSCARRLIVVDDGIIEPLIKATKEIRVGAYTDQPEPFMGPVVSQAAADKLEQSFQGLVASGGKTLVPFERIGCFLRAAIIDMTGCKTDDVELFGPILQVRRVSDLDAAISEANNSAFGLVAALLSEDAQEYERFFDAVRSGVINWNMPTTGASSRAPFGGLGVSGNCRPSGYLAADYTAYPVASQECEHLHSPAILPPGVILP